MSDLDAFIVPAELRVDRGIGTDRQLSQAEILATLYRPTVLVMTFPPGELEELRRLLND